MLASAAITLLKSSELKQLAVKDDAAAVLGFLNLAVLELHKRFILIQEEAVVTQATGVTTYVLATGADNVVIDLSDHEILIIEKVYDEDDLPYIINGNKDEDFLKISPYNTIRVAADAVEDGYVMNVEYRGTPIFMTADTDAVPLAPQFYDALFTYVAYKSHLGVKAGLKDENNTYYLRFEAACKRIIDEGLFPQDDLYSTKFESRGFA